MALASMDKLHPDLVKKNPSKVPEIFFNITNGDFRLSYWVEGGGYLTEDNQLWVPSWGRVWKKISPEHAKPHKGVITIDGEWYAPNGDVSTSLGGSTPFKALPPLPKNSKRYLSQKEHQEIIDQQEIWYNERKFCQFFQHFKLFPSVSYRIGSGDWKFCPVDDAHSI